MTLQPLENIYQEVDHQLAIAENAHGTPKSWLFLDEFGQVLQGIQKRKALCFIVSAPGAIVTSSLDDLCKVQLGSLVVFRL